MSKAPDDPVCPRVSMGGSKDIGGFYCTYRGEIGRCIEIAEAALDRMKMAQAMGKEPKIDRRFKELGAS